jgi:uridylate kinase
MSQLEQKTGFNIISLGGSLIVPDEIDTVFLKSFLDFIKEEVREGKKYIIITGGGKVCRRYQKAGMDLGANDIEESDWIGIHVTRMNANFLRILLKDLVHEDVVINPFEVGEVKKPIIVAAGWKPGWSTDYDAVEMAKIFNAKKIANLSNIDYAYDKDPKIYPDAKKIEQISWADFRKIIPEKWAPGLNSPFDPMAAKNAEEAQIEVAILNGKDILNLKNYFNGTPFKGTVIK